MGGSADLVVTIIKMIWMIIKILIVIDNIDINNGGSGGHENCYFNYWQLLRTYA